MKPLLALYTCHAYNYDMNGMVSYPVRPKMDRRTAIKQTWLNDVDIPYKWFFGASPMAKAAGDDETFLYCPDGYYHLPYKTRAIARWAVDNGYDRVFKVDDDTFIYWDRFKTGPAFAEEVDYCGGGWEPYTYAFGGCYTLAGKMLHAVADADIPAGTWGEDCWVGDVAKKNGIALTKDPSYLYGRVNPHTNIQVVEDEVLLADHSYSVVNPMSPEQMLRFYTH